MSQDHTVMASRYELKYLVPQSLASRVPAFLGQYLELDEFGASQPNRSYPVHSLYLDSDDLKLYWRTVNGDKNRFKLRVRYYDDNPEIPVFFEIKRRMNNTIHKQRCGIHRAAAAMVLSGQLPAPSEMVAPDDPHQIKAIHDFLRLQAGLGAVGKMHIAYEREAYVNDYNNAVRVTLDRFVRATECSDYQLRVSMTSPFVCTGKGNDPDDVVILELKFTERFPNWYRDLVETFNLSQMGAAKYVEGTTMNAGRLMNRRDVIRTMVL